MAQGTVNIYDRNLDQVTPAGVEKKAFFWSAGIPDMPAEIISVNAQTDLDEALGTAESRLKTIVKAAQINGGPNWSAWCYNGSGTGLFESYEEVFNYISPELFILDALQGIGDLADFVNYIQSVVNEASKRVIVLLSCEGIDSVTQTWAAYESALVSALADVKAYRVGVVPNLYGTELGAVAGRLCRGDISIADSPMRVATGPMLGLGEPPVDMDGVPLSSATLAALDAARFSVVQTYPDYPGIYFGDLNLLDSPTGDFQVIEYLRPLDKAARAVRLMAIAKIANREFNSTPESIEAHKTYFARPLREMSQTKRVRDVVLPGDILPPDADAIEIIWVSKTEVEIYISIQPYNSPKKITGYVSLDLSNN